MKFLRIVLILSIVLSSCKSKRVAVESTAVTKSMSARKVSNKHLENSFDKKTIDARLKVAYRDNKNKQKLSVKLRVDKDKVIWLNATYLGIIVARAKITPTTVSYYEKLNRTYFKGNFNALRGILGTDVNFAQLQNMLLGQAIFDLKAQKYKSYVDNQAHLLLPARQKALFDILFWINPIHYKLDKQELKNTSKSQVLKVDYKTYTTIDGEVFPKKIEIRAKEKEKFTNIDIEYKSVVFNKNISTPFRVPRGYKQVEF
jgi:hypothetical protein